MLAVTSMVEEPTGQTVAIIGGGSIGVAFAVVFASAGFQVRVQDSSEARRHSIPGEIRERLGDMATYRLVTEQPDAIMTRVTVHLSVESAVTDVCLVQECAPERLEVKQELFQRLDELTSPTVILASSTSAIPPSTFSTDLPGRHRCLVAHPGNPPYLIPVIELVTTSFVAAATLDRAEYIYRAAGLSPIRVCKEIEGFVFNRLQGALLREAYCLVRDGVASVEDIDSVVKNGLGLRWSIIGPFETVDLNTRGGIASHAVKMGPAYERMGAERGQHEPWSKELIEKVTAARRTALPLEEWGNRIKWRDRQLMKLIAQRRQE